MSSEPQGKKRTNRCIAIELWPETHDILRCLITLNTGVTIINIARHVSAPEISTRNRLIRLEYAGAVNSVRKSARLEDGKVSVSRHYTITQYGRDCVEKKGQLQPTLPVNSVFALAAAIHHSGNKDQNEISQQA